MTVRNLILILLPMLMMVACKGKPAATEAVFVNERVLSGENALHVLDYERASDVIKTASAIGIGICYCRHKMEHIGKNCSAPMDICMTFNGPADSLIRHGIARKVDTAEGLDLLFLEMDMFLPQTMWFQIQQLTIL